MMRTTAIIEGLTILEKYRNSPNGFNVSAEHDQIYVHKTDRPVSGKDIDRLISLHWFQDEVDFGDDEETGGDFAAKHYDPEESWSCFV